MRTISSKRPHKATNHIKAPYPTQPITLKRPNQNLWRHGPAPPNFIATKPMIIKVGHQTLINTQII